MLSLDVTTHTCHPNTLDAEARVESCKFEGQLGYKVDFKPACPIQNLHFYLYRN